MDAPPSPGRARMRAEILLFLVTFVWGSTFIVTKGLLAEVSPFVYITVRFVTAAAVFIAIVPRSLRGWSRGTARRGTVLGLLLFSGFALQTIGLQFTTASTSAFITGMMVVFTPLCQVAIERRRPSVSNLAGVVLVSVGLYLLTSPSSAGFNIGDALTLGSAFLFGLYIVYLDVFSRQDDPAHLTLAQFVVSALGGLAVGPFLETPMLRLSPAVGAQLLYLAVFASVIALSVQTRFQRDTTPTRAALIFSVEPVLAALFAYVLADERMQAVGILGGGIILTGLLISEVGDRLMERVRAR